MFFKLVMDFKKAYLGSYFSEEECKGFQAIAYQRRILLSTDTETEINSEVKKQANRVETAGLL